MAPAGGSGGRLIINFSSLNELRATPIACFFIQCILWNIYRSCSLDILACCRLLLSVYLFADVLGCLYACLLLGRLLLDSFGGHQAQLVGAPQ